jgi:mRNA interferase RelE/StbE
MTRDQPPEVAVAVPVPPTWKLELTPAAVRQLRNLDGSVRRRIVAAIERLLVTQRPAGVKALAGRPGVLRIRVGDYRVVYAVRDEELVVLVIAAAHRSAVYQDL